MGTSLAAAGFVKHLAHSPSNARPALPGWTLAPLVALGLAACHAPELSQAGGELRISAPILDFGDTWLFASSKRPLVLTNTGRTAMQLQFEAAAPFQAPASLLLPGASSATIEPGFRPQTLGAAAGKLVVRSATAQLQVTLGGNGVQQPPCDESACRVAELDPETSSCIQLPRPDGTACEQQCLVNAVCAHGDCLGSPRACDDGDGCTTDACEAAIGCVHLPVRCTSVDPCDAPTCDGASGCTPHPAQDGTPCGESDCSTARVCISGQCSVRVVPDGSSCGTASVCQPTGLCEGQQCVRPVPSTVRRAWMYQPASGRQLLGLVGDEENHLFTGECRPGGTFGLSQCELVSFDVGGTERWRTPCSHSSSQVWGDSLMLAGTRLVSILSRDWIDAFDLTSGRVLWSLDLKTLALFPAGNYPAVQVVSAAFDGHQLVLAVEGSNGGAISGDAVITLDPATGALQHVVHLPAQGFSLVIDRQGLTYLSHFSGPTTARADTVTAFDSSFAVRWQKALPLTGSTIRVMLATHAGQLLLAHQTHSELLSTVTGGVVTSALASYWYSGAPVWGDAALFSMHQYCTTGSCQSYYDFAIDLDAVEVSTLLTHSSRLTPLSWVAPSWLTDKGTALLAMRAGVIGSKPELREIDSNGKVVMECPLEFAGIQVVAGPVLGSGRYAALTGEVGYVGRERLEVWELPGYAPATKGWVSPRGGRRLDMHEQ